jgi:hypothetical protein
MAFVQFVLEYKSELTRYFIFIYFPVVVGALKAKNKTKNTK